MVEDIIIKPVLDIKSIRDIPTLLKEAKWLEGKTLGQVEEEIKKSDNSSRVSTKGTVGWLIEAEHTAYWQGYEDGRKERELKNAGQSTDRPT